MGQGRSLLALTVVKNAQHECGHQGCDVKLNFDQIKDHEEKCVWRLILCPGKGTTCKVRVPFCTVLKHVQTCTDCRWPPKQMDEDGIFIRNTISKDTVVRQNMNSSWSTKVIQFEGRFFFVRSEKKDEYYTVDVVMKGSQEDCENFIVKASLLNVETLYSEGSHQKKSPISMDTFHTGGGSTPFYSFWGCFFLNSQRLFVDKKAQKVRR